MPKLSRSAADAATFSAKIKTDAANWAKVIKSAGLKIK